MDVLNVRLEISKIVKEVTTSQKISNYKITSVQTNQKGEGFLGEIYMITVIDQQTKKTFDIIVKAAFQSPKIRETAPIRLSFENEIYFYSTVQPLYEQMEKEKNPPVDDIIKLTAECFAVSLDEQTEMLALENLKVCGFETFPKQEILDEAHIEMIFKSYGRFHAYSFALRDQQPEKYAETVCKLHNLFESFIKTEYFVMYLEKMMESVKNTLEPGKHDKIIEKLGNYLGPQVGDRFSEAVVNNPDYSCILHGDCWSNNMLFKYNKSGNKKELMDMRLIDFQIIKEGSPVCDLSYCLYSGGSKKEFDNLEKYLTIYYESFSSFLTQLGSNPEKLFPYAALKSEWKKFAKFGMIMGINVVRMKLTDQADVKDLTDFDVQELDVGEMFNDIKFNEKKFAERCNDLLEHLDKIDAL